MNCINPFIATACVLLTVATTTAQKTTTKTVDYNQIPAKSAPIKETDLQRWSHLDLEKDTIPGMSVDKAYELLLKNKKGTPIIVGVIDSGIDIEHEDLKSVIWNNKKEIAGNGLDDDKNGYIDDIHGWNFLGDANDENLELVRIVKKGDDGTDLYKRAKAAYNTKRTDAVLGKQQANFLIATIKTVDDYLKKETYTKEEVEAIQPNDQNLLQSKMIVLSLMEDLGIGFKSEIEEYRKQQDDMVNFNLNMDFNGRTIIGDNPEDLADTKYGNNNVMGLDKEHALHGTHVAGIIAQVRNNGIGGDGVANNVTIMAIRAIPNGDEYDKDVALAIRYAVDNGAKVINGSFGKSFSPHKDWVYDAIKYAASKDVLIVHAAGNDGNDLDLPKNENYPNDSKDGVKEIADNMLTIGALSPTFDENLVAKFSNYGTQNVDIFAPGAKIYATVPNNKYRFLEGTSIASPNAAGVAALIRSYYPKLTAKQVKQIIMDSGTPLTKEVILGETAERRPFTKASKSGKMINAYNALLLAEKMSKK